MAWQKHNESLDSRDLPPAETLLQTIHFMELAGSRPGRALDLGAGAGIDTVALLDLGWQVTAIDKDEPSVSRLRERIDNANLHCIRASFEEMQLETYQLINATFSLPFCRPEAFEDCWQKIVNALEAGGYFCGHFFGPKDSWNIRPDITIHNRQAVELHFKDFDIAWQKEIEKDAPQVNGQIKHWHIFAISARKK